MDSLRVDTGTKRIEVNDDKEYIEFCVMDSGFLEGFSDLSKWLEEKKSYRQEEKSILGKDGSADIGVFDGAVAEYSEIGEQIRERVDRIFGTDATRKIFRGHTPNIFTLSEFIEKISPFIEEDMRERKASVSKKYNKGRRGAKS